ncbi:hypothetical protein [Mesorhizobium sp. NZP2298]|uniref:hypothetical protein n=1 Tax=Mesorhizobium sp. NZP2298 TaxID=2483403 RepID=UPI0015543B2F|nr:hypothetical protein [Mesorhizobium sp. NZP2298]QKC99161.1 hypothetical protein EB231_34795 [Mesorhizobium sp. NZP2298]
MNWLAVIVVTTNMGGVQYMERFPVSSEISCEEAVNKWAADYEAKGLAPAKYFYECVDIGSIVKGAQ